MCVCPLKLRLGGCKISLKLKVSSVCPSVFPSLDQHPIPPERLFQPPVPPLHCGHPVHRREPGTLQPQTHSEPGPETIALPRSVYKQNPHKRRMLHNNVTLLSHRMLYVIRLLFNMYSYFYSFIQVM